MVDSTQMSEGQSRLVAHQNKTRPWFVPGPRLQTVRGFFALRCGFQVASCRLLPKSIASPSKAILPFSLVRNSHASEQATVVHRVRSSVCRCVVRRSVIAGYRRRSVVRSDRCRSIIRSDRCRRVIRSRDDRFSHRRRCVVSSGRRRIIRRDGAWHRRAGYHRRRGARHNRRGVISGCYWRGNCGLRAQHCACATDARPITVIINTAVRTRVIEHLLKNCRVGWFVRNSQRVNFECETIAKSAAKVRCLLLTQVCHSNYPLASNAHEMPSSFLKNFFRFVKLSRYQAGGLGGSNRLREE